MSRSYLTALGRENAKEFYEDNRVIDRCIFCGQHKEIKTTMTIYFSEFETNTGPICKGCYSANAKTAQTS
ncbi:hypothetical protein AKH19_00920 [Pelagibacteraceae bacterium GOM-A1]|jgi:hypothetical protein|nr:hypothetical protein AKH19_00920 [Pelagibacteraceae bacterium GOM-A1]|tara:strand:- start:5 stop:214 length:210 start_codon:yes stop_codon:yes gene_type:complete